MPPFRPLIAVALAVACALAAPAAPAVAAEPPRDLRRGVARGELKALVAMGDWHAAGRGGRADWAGALAWWRRAAKRGDAAALGKMAACYEAGRGCRKDVGYAWRCWVAAAHGGDPALRLQVARRLIAGQGVRRDRGLGRRLLAFGAVRGEVRAQRELGEVLAADAASDGDRLAALRWLARAALGGEPAAAGAWKRVAARLPAAARRTAEADAEALWASDPRRAARAAALGLPGAVATVGGAAPALTEALERVAARSPAAMVRLARRHLALEGPAGARRDPAQALAWYRRAAARGHVDAMLALADLTGPGGAGPRDDAGALAWLVRAARAGSATAMRRVGERVAAGEGAAADPHAALRWFEAAARRGEPAALAKLGSLAEAPPIADPVAAAAWWGLAARRGLPGAQATADRLAAALPEAGRAMATRRMAAWALRHPAAGVSVGLPERGDDEATRLRALAEAGAPWAQTALGHALARGRFGAKDEAEAATWWLRAAAQDDRLAQANLVELFVAGHGLPKDPTLAYGYWCLATGADPATGKQAYPHAAGLTPAAIAEAGRQVAAWRRAHDDLPPDPKPVPSP